jgi:integrase/recombinase XerD
LFCVITGRTRGHRWSAGAARLELRRIAMEAGVGRRFAPHQLRHEGDNARPASFIRG